jgi:peptidoglycan hydrolase CwlO-like protein
MSREELILEIIEKVYENVQRLEGKIDALTEEQVRQNVVVTEHERRSTAAEKRLELLQQDFNSRLQSVEKDANFAHILIKICTYGGAIVLFLVKVLPFISSRL